MALHGLRQDLRVLFPPGRDCLADDLTELDLGRPGYPAPAPGPWCYVQMVASSGNWTGPGMLNMAGPNAETGQRDEPVEDRAVAGPQAVRADTCW